jgi:spore germination protein YaaH
MSEYKKLKNKIFKLEQDVETETLKNNKLNEALKNSMQNWKDLTVKHSELIQRKDEINEVKNMLIIENSNLKSFNERKTETISDLISQNLTKDNEISHLKYMIEQMRGW